MPKPEDKLDYFPGWLRLRLEEVWPGRELKIVAALGMGGSTVYVGRNPKRDSRRFKIPANYLYIKKTLPEEHKAYFPQNLDLLGNLFSACGFSEKKKADL